MRLSHWFPKLQSEKQVFTVKPPQQCYLLASRCGHHYDPNCRSCVSAEATTNSELKRLRGDLVSFDDTCIGRADEDFNKIVDPLIKRPRGLSKSDWYEHASAVCKVMNSRG